MGVSTYLPSCSVSQPLAFSQHLFFKTSLPPSLYVASRTPSRLIWHNEGFVIVASWIFVFLVFFSFARLTGHGRTEKCTARMDETAIKLFLTPR